MMKDNGDITVMRDTITKLCLDLDIGHDVSRLSDKMFKDLMLAAQAQGIQGLAAKFLKRTSKISSPSHAHAQRVLQLHRLAHTRVKAEAAIIARAFSERGIPLVYLKGFDYAERLYDSSAERDVGSDIDILVSHTDVLEAEAVLHKLGYQTVDARDPVWTNDPEVRRQYRLKYSHDPIIMTKNGMIAELHQTRNFNGLNIKSIFESTTKKHTNRWIGESYLLTDLDLLVLASWHIFHHCTVLPDRPWKHPLTLRQFADWWRAYKRAAQQGLDVITSHVAACNATHMVLLAAKKTSELFDLVDAGPPSDLLDLISSLASNLSSEHRGLARLLDRSWRYGAYITSFWEYAFDTDEVISRIQAEAAARKHLVVDTYEALHCEDVEAVVHMCESDYTPGSDRLLSYVYRDYGVTDGLPTVSWAARWTPEHLHIKIKLNTKYLVTDDFQKMPPRYTNKVHLFVSSDVVSAKPKFDIFAIALGSAGASIWKLQPTLERLGDARFYAVKKDKAFRVEIQCTIPQEYLPVALMRGTTFALKMRYIDHSTCETINTVLQWPSGVSAYGIVCLS